MAQTPQPNLEQFLLEKAKTYKEQANRGKMARTQTAVRMQRRCRANNASDCFGFFSTNEGSYAWLGDQNQKETEALANMRCLPIVKPTVRALVAAMVTANVQVKVDPAGKVSKRRAATSVARGLCEFFDGNDDYWSGLLEARVNEMSILNFGYAVRSRHNPEKECKSAQYDEFEPEDVPMPGEYACQCGSSGPLDDEVTKDPNGMARAKCPDCGSWAEVTKEPYTAQGIPMPKGRKEFNPGDNETLVASAYELSADELHSQGGNLNAAEWFEYHHLVSEDELKAAHPDFDLGGASEWSFSLKWQHALETGDDRYLKSRWGDLTGIKLYEVREIYMRPVQYRNYVAPQGKNEIKDGKGNVVFSLEPGEKITTKYPKGVCFYVTGEKLLPKIEGRDFRREWSYGGFHTDGHSLWMQPMVELAQSQDDGSAQYTAYMQYLDRNSVANLIYDGRIVNQEDMAKDLVPTKEGYDYGDDIGKRFFQVQPPRLQGPLEGLNLILSLVPKISGVQPPMVGEPQNGQPYAAQLLQKQSSLGMLTPSQQSKARVKVQSFKQHCRVAQETWPTERFEYLRERFGGEWKEQDIEAFLECDLDLDLVFSYVEGTEIPTSRLEREIKLQVVLEFIAKMAPQMVTPELVSMYFDLAGIDYDFENTEGDTQLAEVRYDRILEALPAFGQIPPEQIGTYILALPGMKPRQRENHKVHMEYYADRQRAALAQDQPNELLADVCDAMIEAHEQAETGMAQTQAAQQAIAAQPMVQAQQAAQAGQQQDNGQQAQADAAKAEADRQSASQEAEAARQHEAEQAQADRSHEINKLAMTQQHERESQDAEHAQDAMMQDAQLAAQTEQARQRPQGATR